MSISTEGKKFRVNFGNGSRLFTEAEFIAWLHSMLQNPAQRDRRTGCLEIGVQKAEEPL